MSEVTTLLAWLIPCLVIVLAIIIWRVYVYKTRGPALPSYLQRNIFARTASFLPRTLSFNSIKDTSTNGGDAKQQTAAPAVAIRNETRVDMSEPSAVSQPFTPVSHQEKQDSISPATGVTPNSPGSIPTTESKPVSPAVSRLLSMQ